MLPTYTAWNNPKAAKSRYKPLQAATSPFCTMLYVANLHHPKATTFLLYWAVCCRPTVPGTTPKPLKAATSHFCTMVHVVNLHHPKATTLHPFFTGLYVANLHGLKPPQSRYIPLLYYAVAYSTSPQSRYIPSTLGCMLPTYRAWNHPKAATSPFCTMLYVVSLQYIPPKPLHPFYTGLYVANLQGLKPPQSRYIPLLYYALHWAVCCQPTGLKPPQSRYIPLLYYAVCCQPTVHPPKAATSLLHWAVCCQPTGPETTPKPLHPFCTMLYVVSLQYIPPKPLHPFYTGLYVANLQGLKPPQSRYIPLLYYAVCCQPTVHPPKAATSLLHWAVWCQPTGPETTPKPLHSFYSGLYVSNHPRAIPKAFSS